MEQLIQFQHSISSLTDTERQQFVNNLGHEQVIQIIFDRFLEGLKNVESVNKLNNELIPKLLNINQNITSIIRSRKDKIFKTEEEQNKISKMCETMTLEHLPTEMISGIASYLTLRQAIKLENSSKSLFIAVRSLPLINNNLNGIINNSNANCGPIYHWHRFDGISAATIDYKFCLYLEWNTFSSLFRNLHTLKLVATYNLNFEKWRNRLEQFFVNDAATFQCIMGNIKQLQLNFIPGPDYPGYAIYDFFKSHTIPYVNSLEKLKMEFDLYQPIVFSTSDDNVLPCIVGQNLNTLRDMSFVSYCDDECIFEKDYISLFWAPIFAIYNQCLMHPEWTMNVLDKVEFVITDTILIDAGNGIDRCAVMDKVNALAMLFTQNHVSFLFEVNFKRDEELRREYPEDAKCEDETLQELEIVFGRWRIKDRKSIVTFQLNNDIFRQQKLITDFFL